MPTLVDQIWTSHVVATAPGRPDLLYVDLQLVHEVTSPQAFEGLRRAGRTVRRPDLTIATVDHNVPTRGRFSRWTDALAVDQVEALRANCREFGVTLLDIDDDRQGIVHVVGPEQGLTQPGMTIVCGDSHTSTHGAFGALAFGIGTSEVEQVLATQTLSQARPKSMAVTLTGALPASVSAKDLALHVILQIGVDGGRGFVIEYRGPAIADLDMEARMTLCNMSIEGGARAGLIAPDEVTFAYLRGRPFAPAVETGAWEEAEAAWRSLRSDDDASFDREVVIDASAVQTCVTWGTNPAQSVDLGGRTPDPEDAASRRERAQIERALDYMGLAPNTAMRSIAIDRVFIGSCTNARLSDLRAAAAVVRGRRIAGSVQAMVVPGSGLVKARAEAEGLHEVFRAAGFEWREPGCSMCLAMNPDKLEPGQRCASTSNRNFEGRQGRGGRTHLVSPTTAAASAIAGRFASAQEVG